MTDQNSARNQQQTSVGNLIVIAAPSGAGKTSLVAGALSAMPDVKLSVSHTTRPMREGEVDGKDYYFVDVPTFQQMVANEAFIEHAEVFGNFYGTSKQALARPLSKGHDIILEIDWQGALAIKNSFPDAIRVFILPPSIEALIERLVTRGKDDQAIIDRRMMEAREQIGHYQEFDYLIVNDNFHQALDELKGLIKASRLRLNAQKHRYSGLIHTLLSPENTP